MTNKEKLEIIKLFRIVLKNQHLFKLGLCSWVSKLYWKEYQIITYCDYLKLQQYLNNNLPNPPKGRLFCWEVGKIEPRINWINEQIKKLKKEIKENNKKP